MLALALYAACALWATWPAIRHVDGHYLARPAAGFGEAAAGDHLQLGWSFWLVGHQLEHAESPLADPYSFRPEAEAPPNLQGWLLGAAVLAARGGLRQRLGLRPDRPPVLPPRGWLRLLVAADARALAPGGARRRCRLLPHAVSRGAVDRAPAGARGVSPAGAPARARTPPARRRRARPLRPPALRPAPPRARRDPPRARLRVGATAEARLVEGRSRRSRRGRGRAGRRALDDRRLDRCRSLFRPGRALLGRADGLRDPVGRQRRRGARLRRLADAPRRARRAVGGTGPTRARGPARPRGARPVSARAGREPARLRDALARRARPRRDPRPGAPAADRLPRARGARRARRSSGR